ncbi:MAG: hypothetical protein ABIZ56_02505 [Chthoniobacteraceae bacterium]
MNGHWLLRLDWGEHPVTAGRLVYLLKTKFSHGLSVAHYRDGVRPRILSMPPLDFPEDRSGEIHVLTSEDDWLNLIWALRSFHKSTGRNYALCIHDDGSLRAKAMGILRTTFPHARIISRSVSDARMAEVLAAFPGCRGLRTTNKLSLKVFDFAAFLEADRMILLDSDILFFDKPTALLTALHDPHFTHNTLNKDWGDGYTIDLAATRPFLDFDCPPRLNSGLGVIHKSSLRLDWIEQFLTLPGILSHPHQIEQTLIALCSAKHGFTMLPAEYDVHLGPRNPSAPSRHYAGPTRPLMYSEGIAELVKGNFLK